MSNWNYAREERPEAKTGIQRCVIVSAEEGMTKGNAEKGIAPAPKIILKVKQSGSGIICAKHIVKGEWFNKTMTEVFDSFPEIEEGDFTLPTWVGAEGAAFYKTDNNGYLDIAYFVSPKRAADLPPFEGSKPERITVTEIGNDDDDDDIPFLV